MSERVVAGPAGRWAIAILFAAHSIAAQNLAANSEFDTDVLPWYVGTADSAIAWTNLDHSGCSSSISGAALATNTASNVNQGRGTAVCITGLVPGQAYSFGGDLRFPPGQARTGSARMLIVWLASSDCTGFSRSTVDSDITIDTSSAGTWFRVQGTGVADKADGSVALVTRWIKNEAGGSLQVDFDGAYFVPGEGFLFGDGFERQSTCHWSSVSP